MCVGGSLKSRTFVWRDLINLDISYHHHSRQCRVSTLSQPRQLQLLGRVSTQFCIVLACPRVLLN